MLQKQTDADRLPKAEGRPAVIFDLDGTLLDTSGDLLAAANACFAARGLGEPLTPADAATALIGGRAMLRLGYSRLAGVYDDTQFDHDYPELLRHYEKAIAVHSRPYEGMVAAVNELRAKGYAVAICTNKPAYLAEALMRELGLRDLFDALVGADTLPVRKPDPAPYRLAVAEAGGLLAQSLIVGDTNTDLSTARAAGVPAILVTFGPDPDGVLGLEPDAWLSDYADLSAIVAELIG